jgi:hypothetical protein
MSEEVKKSNNGKAINAKTHVESVTNAYLSMIGARELGRFNSIFRHCIGVHWMPLGIDTLVSLLVPAPLRIDEGRQQNRAPGQ